MKTVCIILGTVSLALGIIGIFLPLLPTTPFLLLTAALYFRGSPRLYQWLLNHKCLGPYIRSFRENKAIPLRAKIISLLLMWGTMVYCIFFLIPLTEIKIALFLVAVGVTWHILSFKIPALLRSVADRPAAGAAGSGGLTKYSVVISRKEVQL